MHSEPTTAADILGRAAKLRAKFYGKPDYVRRKMPEISMDLAIALANPAVPAPPPELALLLEPPPEKRKGRPSIRAITEHVAAEFGVPMAALLSHRRARELVEARWVVMWIARHATTHTLPVIGEKLQRDHTTTLHGIRKLDAEVAAGTELGLRAVKCRDNLLSLYEGA